MVYPLTRSELKTWIPDADTEHKQGKSSTPPDRIDGDPDMAHYRLTDCLDLPGGYTGFTARDDAAALAFAADRLDRYGLRPLTLHEVAPATGGTRELLRPLTLPAPAAAAVAA